MFVKSTVHHGATPQQPALELPLYIQDPDGSSQSVFLANVERASTLIICDLFFEL